MAPIVTSLASLINQFGLAAVTAPSGGGAYAGASGGVISDYNSGGTNYRAHIFTSSGTFTVTDPTLTSVEYLVVGGGGGGGAVTGGSGYAGAGGGGAGGFRTNIPGYPAVGSTYNISTGSYTVTVGAGGAGGQIPWLSTESFCLLLLQTSYPNPFRGQQF